jgi:hypothetical protein
MKLKYKLPKNVILRFIVIIFLIGLVISFWPFILGWWLISLIRKHMGNKKLKTILIALIVFIFISFGSIWFYALVVSSKSQNSTSQTTPTPTSNSTPIPTILLSPTKSISESELNQTSVSTPSIKLTPTNPPIVENANSKCISVNGLPDSSCTPGSIDSRVIQDNIKETICKSGYTTTVRPSTSYTNNLKTIQIKEYGYINTNLSAYEEDHLIPLELGGNPTDPKNLWPEPGSSPNSKDSVENYCKKIVCLGQLALETAQKEIANDWHTACGYKSTTNTSTLNVVIPVVVSNVSPGSSNNSATGICNDGTYTYTVNHKGACSHHKGVKTWY